VAGLLTFFPDPSDVAATAYKGIRRLLPGHLLIAEKETVRVRKWWSPEELEQLGYSKPEDYHQAFLEIYADAVAKRLRVKSEAKVVASLSGGLDSGSVVAMAAPGLAGSGQRLTAYVHRPLYLPSGTGPNRIGDEFTLAQKTANFVGNVDTVPILGERTTVLQGVRRDLAIHDTPTPAAYNAYWIYDLLETARAGGARVLLTGQGGNATISYAGSGDLIPKILNGSMAAAWTALSGDDIGLWRSLKRRVIKPLVQPARAQLSKMGQSLDQRPWSSYSVINAKFARDLRLLGKMHDAGHNPDLSKPRVDSTLIRDFRLGHATAGTTGAIWMETGAAFGIDIRDPTFDKRIVEFCWRVPDEVFWARGRQRGLVRDGMKTYLPQEVVFSSRRGLQSADLVERLRTQSGEIESAIQELERHPLCQSWLDIPYLRRAWATVSEQSVDKQIFNAAGMLMRGIGVGLFLQQF
jgi:asparagine synthase (glutamine-hydrolysing)